MKKKTFKKVTQYGSILLMVIAILSYLTGLKGSKLNSESLTIQKNEERKDRFMLSIIPKTDKDYTKFIRPFGLKKLTDNEIENVQDKRQLVFYPMTIMECKNNLNLTQYDSLSFFKKTYFFELQNGFLEDFKITKSYSIRYLTAFTDSGYKKQVIIPLHDLLKYKHSGKQKGQVLEMSPNTAYLEIFEKCLKNYLKTENYKHFVNIDYTMIEVKLGEEFKHYNLDKGIMISHEEFRSFVDLYDSFKDVNPLRLNNVLNNGFIYEWYLKNKNQIVAKKEFHIRKDASYRLETCSSNRDSIMSLIKIIDNNGNMANTLKF